MKRILVPPLALLLAAWRTPVAREKHRWLQHTSALGELIDHDYSTLSLDRPYQVADKLLKNKKAIEALLSEQESLLFNIERCIILYDLTNAYFEGQALGNTKAAIGRSKEKRSDCPLMTMGLVLDGEGFRWPVKSLQATSMTLRHWRRC
ncbi:MAG: hypothetical protein ACI9Y1_003252 [Lentisphaeria bacterium]|jgi:hypothetical protein